MQNKKREEEPKDPSRRKFLKSAGKLAKNAAIVGIGVSAFGTKEAFSGQKESEATKKVERNLESEFDLGIKVSAEEEEKILNENYDVEVISGGNYYNLDGYGLPYKRRAFAHMTAKYGKERVMQFLDFLENSYPENLKERDKSREKIMASYGRELPRMSEEREEVKIRLNRKLYDIADSLEKMELEKFVKLFEVLREDGYDKKYDFTWNSSVVDRLLSDEGERRAMIEFQNAILDGGKGGARYLKLKQSIGEEKFNSMTYKERLQAFNSIENS